MEFIKKLSINYCILILIVVFALIIRTYNISENPPGFFADEASIGYNAYTIGEKMTDEHGNFLPAFFEAFGDYKSPVQIYSTVPIIKIFGLNEFSIRFVSVLYGTGTIIAIYYLTKELFHSFHSGKNIAFGAAFFLAISPWHVHLSRTALEGLMPFVFFTTLGTYFFLKAKKHYPNMPIAIVLYSLALYSYFPARVFIPIFVLVLGGVFAYAFSRSIIRDIKTSLLSLLLFFILIAPMALHIASGEGLSRWKTVSIFNSPPKTESVMQHVIKNYASHFSVDFLFTKGDAGMPGQFITRHSVGQIGELYIFQIPLLLIGIYSVAKKYRGTAYVIFAWLILYPIGSMFTVSESAQATRSVVGVIPFQIISAVGLYTFINASKKNHLQKFMLMCWATIIIISIVHFLNLNFIKYPKIAADFWGWQYGARDIVTYFVEEEENYDQLFMMGEFNAPEIFLKFYSPRKCGKCAISSPDILYTQNSKQLFAVTPVYIQNHPEFSFTVKKTIYYPNGQIAFMIGEVEKANL